MNYDQASSAISYAIFPVKNGSAMNRTCIAISTIPISNQPSQLSQLFHTISTINIQPLQLVNQLTHVYHGQITLQHIPKTSNPAHRSPPQKPRKSHLRGDPPASPQADAHWDAYIVG